MSGIDHSRALTRRYSHRALSCPSVVGIHLSGGYGELAQIFRLNWRYMSGFMWET